MSIGGVSRVCVCVQGVCVSRVCVCPGCVCVQGVCVSKGMSVQDVW